MTLKELAKLTSYTSKEQAYFLAHIEEIGATEFVQELCDSAEADGFDNGFEIGAEEDV